jgi:hypothetical protein
MQVHNGSILGASLSVLVLLATNVTPLSANTVEFNYGSFLSVYDVGSESEGPVSPTSITVTPDGLSVAINSGARLFDADSVTQKTIDESPFLTSFWQPMWLPAPEAHATTRPDGFLSSPPSKDVTLGNTGLGNTPGGIGAFDTVSDIDSIPAIVPAIDLTSTAIPEPSTLSLLALSLGFLILLRRVWASTRAGYL